jgi:hypothetical protein
MELLLNGIGWVTILYKDGSLRVIHTTLNEDILASYGVKPRVGFIFDVDRGEFVAFREDATDINVSSDKPVFTDEVINFANRFI